MKAQGYTTISPSVTAGADGIAWLKSFYKQCGGAASEHCGADVLAFHYYGMDPNDFISYAQKFHAITGGTVWVTEMACQVCSFPFLFFSSPLFPVDSSLTSGSMNAFLSFLLDALLELW